MLGCIEPSAPHDVRARVTGLAGRLLHHRTLIRHEVRPLDDAERLSGEATAFRVVLAGSGITSGWGVSTHRLALSGSVQRALQQRLGRPVDVRQVSRIGALLGDAIDVLEDRLDGTEHVVVLAFGWSDAFALTPVSRWTETLNGLLDVLGRGRPGPLPVVVVGLPPMDSLGIAGLLGPFVRRHGERLNEASRTVAAARPGTVFVPLDTAANTDLRPSGSPEAYAVWSLPIADAIAAAKDPDEDIRIGGMLGELYRRSAAASHTDRGPRSPVQDAARARRRRPSPSRRGAAAVDAVRMRTGVHDYAMRVLEDLGHPPLIGPTGAPCRTLAVGPRPVRVLFFGAGLAIGYGVRSREDAVDGPFAQALSGALDRGVVLENRAAKHLPLEQTIASLGAVGTWSYDLAVWFPSFSDGIERLRPGWWRNRLHTMIRELRADGHVPLLLSHMPVPAGLHPAALIARPWVRRLNRVIDQVAAEWDDVRTAATEPFFPAEVGQKITDRAYFHAVSDRLLPAAVGLLLTGRPAASTSSH
ncbi:GDSL-type esterase/lipase family protein [Amnibacterium kyonggiense]|uniref:GDSL-like lipase/acylhydrolase family protein n=1 Tax=Amnibacterium kyonggiense TaxID=595671 RepID=A0A4R7FPI6_9MICO|nr:GDSL-type esterase/lipase family protein [Amnibacterium kyonggiense]TDS79613.1 GDSL-like lipase/acylhydrolase family protein [Amnibacterium kyonggiense]